MPRELIALYQNGNYTVKLYSNGTKIKQTTKESFVAKFPDSIDLKITNYCDRNCPMCHEKSSKEGSHADLDAPFLKTLKKGTELAIGGGNPLLHPKLLPFLKQMKSQGIICNLTINEVHLKQSKTLVLDLIENKLVYGLGVSLKAYDEEIVSFAKAHSNVVLHVINGVFTEYDKLASQGLKILILGYKKFGRGKEYFSAEIEHQMNITREILPGIIAGFKLVSFDNLALEQLSVKSLISNREFEQIYMGDDGEGTMYIDLVNSQFAKSSTSTERYPLQDEIIPMFKQIQVKK